MLLATGYVYLQILMLKLVLTHITNPQVYIIIKTLNKCFMFTQKRNAITQHEITNQENSFVSPKYFRY